MGDQKKLCFVVGPIGEDGSENRIHADWLLEGIINPVFEQHFSDFKVERADKIDQPGRIDGQVITALLDADLVIADLSTHNPNAFYEIGIRHVVAKPIIHMFLEGQSIPFDVAPYRSIKFDRKRPSDLHQAQINLKAHVEAILAPGYVVDNPVTAARGKIAFMETATPKERVMQEQIDALDRRVRSFEETRAGLGRAFTSNINVLAVKNPSATDLVHEFVDGGRLKLRFRDEASLQAFVEQLARQIPDSGFAEVAREGDTCELFIVGPGGRVLDGPLRQLAATLGVKILSYSVR